VEILKDAIFVQWLVACLFSVVVWMFGRAVISFEKSIKDLYEKYASTDARLARIEAIHSVKGCDGRI